MASALFGIQCHLSDSDAILTYQPTISNSFFCFKIVFNVRHNIYDLIDSVVELSHSKCSTGRNHQNKQYSKNSEFLFLKNPIDPLSMNYIDDEDIEDEIEKTEDAIKVEIINNSVTKSNKYEEERSQQVQTKVNLKTTSTASPPVVQHLPHLVPQYYFPIYPQYVIHRYPYHIPIMFHCYPLC